MAGVKLPYRLSDYELVAYRVSNYFIKLGYLTDVKKEENNYTVYIFQERVLKNIIGTPSVVKATFYPLDKETGIEVKSTFVKVNASNIIKEVISSALIFPGINKITQLNKIKKLVKKRVLIEAEKLKDGGK